MNISLIGMPACGKTETAKALKNLLNDYSLIDTDEKIVQNERRSINDIFLSEGEEYFRILETNILKQVLQGSNIIISTGGGIVKSKENIELLKQKSKVIYIKTDIETLFERAKQNTQRPLLKTTDIKERLINLLKEREWRYKEAHFTIETEGKTPETIAKEIMEKINENGRSNN